MNRIIERIDEIATAAWLKLLSRLNGLMMIACAGVVMLNQTNPGFVQSLTKEMTPTQQGMATFAFCCIVQFAIARAKKANG